MDLLAHLEAYVAVAERQSFSAAADKLGIAQPLLSRRIKMLERHLGGELFDRTRRQIVSTDLGTVLLPHAREVLSRTDHLRQVARTTLASTAHVLGVPPDCDPGALARVMRAGTDRGVTIRVREAPAQQRAAELADGTLTYALNRIPPESAPFVVPLGLAAAEPLTQRGRPVHLESLRPHRSAVGTVEVSTAAPAVPAILVTVEDGFDFAGERFARAAARAGLAERRIRTVTSPATAVAETLAGDALLVCAEPVANRHDLRWSPLADATLHRGYELASAGRRVGPDLLDWMMPPLADAIGATGVVRGPDREAVDGPDSLTRLAARG